MHVKSLLYYVSKHWSFFEQVSYMWSLSLCEFFHIISLYGIFSFCEEWSDVASQDHSESTGPLELLCNEVVQWIWQAWCWYAVNQLCVRTSDCSKSFLNGEAEAFMNYSRWKWTEWYSLLALVSANGWYVTRKQQNFARIHQVLLFKYLLKE
jgi:hypothetical protein